MKKKAEENTNQLNKRIESYYPLPPLPSNSLKRFNS